MKERKGSKGMRCTEKGIKWKNRKTNKNWIMMERKGSEIKQRKVMGRKGIYRERKEVKKKVGQWK